MEMNSMKKVIKISIILSWQLHQTAERIELGKSLSFEIGIRWIVVASFSMVARERI